MTDSSLIASLKACRGILFDLDGVLIDSEPLHAAALHDVGETLGRRLSEEEIRSFKGIPEKTVAQGMQGLFPEAGLTVERFVELKLEKYRARFEHVRAVPGAKEFLQRCQEAGLILALTTSSAPESQSLACETFGYTPYFRAIVTGADITKGKPDPEPYLLTASKVGLDPRACLVIEDSLSGVRSGKGAGCVVIALTTTFSRAELEEAGADGIVEGFADIEAMLF